MTETEKGFGYCDFEFVCYLLFVILNLPGRRPLGLQRGQN